MPSPNQMAEEDRQDAINQGRYLQDRSRERAGNEGNLRNMYRLWAEENFGPQLSQGGNVAGMTPEEQANYLQEGGLRDLGWTPEEGDANYLTDSERSAWAGDPQSRFNYFNPDYMTSMQSESERNQRQAVQGMRDQFGNAIDPDRLRTDPEYRNQIAGTLNTTDEGVAGTLEGTEGAVRGAFDRGKLTQDQGAASRIRMTPEQQQDIVTGAGISAGTGYRASIGALERQAKAAGTNPMGVAAYRARAEREAAGEAGDAMTKARIAANEAAAGREMELEKNRQGTEQYLASETAQNEQELGRARVGATERSGARRMGALADVEDRRSGAERDISNRQMQATSETGRAGLSSEQDINRQQQGVARFNTQTGTDIQTGVERDTSDRARAQAENRQNTARYNSSQRYGRGMDINRELSGRYGNVANQRMADTREARGFLERQSGLGSRNEQGEYDRQGQLYGAQGQLANQATANRIRSEEVYQRYKGPGVMDRIGGAIQGGMQGGMAGGPWGAVGGAAAGALTAKNPNRGMAKGGIVTEPTYALIGEDGPEAVVPLNGRKDAAVKPSDVNYLDAEPMARGGIAMRPTLAKIGEAGPEAIVPMRGGYGSYGRGYGQRGGGFGGGYGNYRQPMRQQGHGNGGGYSGRLMQAEQSRMSGWSQPSAPSWQQPPEERQMYMNATNAAQQEKQRLMSQGMSEQDAHMQATKTYESQTGGDNYLKPDTGAAPQQEMAQERSWSSFGQQVGQGGGGSYFGAADQPASQQPAQPSNPSIQDQSRSYLQQQAGSGGNLSSPSQPMRPSWGSQGGVAQAAQPRQQPQNQYGGPQRGGYGQRQPARRAPRFYGAAA